MTHSISLLAFAPALLVLGCGQSEPAAWAAFCSAPSVCPRPADLDDPSDEAREARDQYIICVTSAARSAVDNGSVRDTYEAAIREHDPSHIARAIDAVGIESCPMLDLIREDP